MEQGCQESEKYEYNEPTIECKSIEEFHERTKAYVAVEILKAIDQKQLLQTNIAYLKTKIWTKKLAQIETRIKQKKLQIQYKGSKKFDLSKDPWIQQRIDKYLKVWAVQSKLEAFQIYQITDIASDLLTWLLFTTHCSWNWNYTFSINRATNKGEKDINTYLDDDTFKYLAYTYIDKTMKAWWKQRVTYDSLPKPLPPTHLPLDEQENLELEREKTLKQWLIKASNVENFSLSSETVFVQPNKSLQRITITSWKSLQTKSEHQIWDEKIDKQTYDLYIKYKRVNMQYDIKNKIYVTKAWAKYTDLSWEFFRNNVLNKDTEYIIQ